MRKISWKIPFSIILIIISVLIYYITFLLFGESEGIVHFVLEELGFIPIDILVVALVLDEIIERKQKENFNERLDLLLSVFYGEIGEILLSKFSQVNENSGIKKQTFKNIENWDNKQFTKIYKTLENEGMKFNLTKNKESEEFLKELQGILHSKRQYLSRILENPDLTEKNEFVILVLSLLHLSDELNFRNLNNISEDNFNHLVKDIQTSYTRLSITYIYYLEVLKRTYPHMLTMAIEKITP